ncbi:MAG: hypothetical protein ACTSRK_08495 [Promethearchaeota archaeon]
MEIFHKLRMLFLFNTIEESKDGLTYYDLKKYSHMPQSKIYRMMNRLHEDGFLLREESQNDLGRPKYLFSLSDKGLEKKQDIQEELEKFILFLKERFPEHSDFDEEKFLSSASLEMWQDPVSHILSSEKSLGKKLKILQNMQEDIIDRHSEVDSAIQQVEAEIAAKKDQ